MAGLCLAALPNELLVAIAGHLDVQPLYCWMRTARPFYDLFVTLLYKRDLDLDPDANGDGAATGRQRSLRAGIEGNLATLQRALAVGPSLPPGLYAAAIRGDRPLEVVSLLLSRSVTDEATAAKNRFWPMLQTILDAAQRPPTRWCPVPVVSCFLEHGYTLKTTSHGPDKDSEVVSAAWSLVFALVQVHGPRPRRRPGGHSGHSARADPDELRHDHCQHGSEACNVAMMRLLLHKGKAKPGSAPWLVARAMKDARRPVELLRFLADAGADLNAPVPSASSGVCTPILAALEDALRLQSLSHNPRGRSWDCHPPQVAYPKADDVVQFLLSRGVDGVEEADGGGGGGGGSSSGRSGCSADSLTLRLLDYWDPGWRRFKRRPAKHARRKKGGGKDARNGSEAKKQRLE